MCFFGKFEGGYPFKCYWNPGCAINSILVFSRVRSGSLTSIIVSNNPAVGKGDHLCFGQGQGFPSSPSLEEEYEQPAFPLVVLLYHGNLIFNLPVWRSQVRRYRARCVVFEILGVGVPSRSHGNVGKWCGNVGGDPSYVLELVTHFFNFDTWSDYWYLMLHSYMYILCISTFQRDVLAVSISYHSLQHLVTLTKFHGANWFKVW